MPRICGACCKRATLARQGDGNLGGRSNGANQFAPSLKSALGKTNCAPIAQKPEPITRKSLVCLLLRRCPALD